ncbi:MAG: NAD(P)H-dependent oxidoreductase subunit E [Deltaproteobacteria bacterium]|nr:NAD(P)H-dependent oxidoreductase subunit E [Deltaproteobacteria bacterium]
MELLDQLARIIDGHGGQASSLVQVLLEIQAAYRWLPGAALPRVSERLGVPLSRVRHIATFYKAFSLVPKGRHQVHVCLGTACHVRGAARVLASVAEKLDVQPGETDAELRFSLETVNCLGCCALGPVIEIDGKIHGKLSTEQTAAVLAGYE